MAAKAPARRRGARAAAEADRGGQAEGDQGEAAATEQAALQQAQLLLQAYQLAQGQPMLLRSADLGALLRISMLNPVSVNLHANLLQLQQ